MGKIGSLGLTEAPKKEVAAAMFAKREAVTPFGYGVFVLDQIDFLSSAIRNPKSAIQNQSGPVRSYIILRRQHLPGQKFTDWAQEGMALKPEITLTNQPRFMQLEYCIIAVNGNGTSVPSNVAAVVL